MGCHFNNNMIQYSKVYILICRSGDAREAAIPPAAPPMGNGGIIIG